MKHARATYLALFAALLVQYTASATHYKFVAEQAHNEHARNPGKFAVIIALNQDNTATIFPNSAAAMAFCRQVHSNGPVYLFNNHTMIADDNIGRAVWGLGNQPVVRDLFRRNSAVGAFSSDGKSWIRWENGHFVGSEPGIVTAGFALCITTVDNTIYHSIRGTEMVVNVHLPLEEPAKKPTALAALEYCRSLHGNHTTTRLPRYDIPNEAFAIKEIHNRYPAFFSSHRAGVWADNGEIVTASGTGSNLAFQSANASAASAQHHVFCVIKCTGSNNPGFLAAGVTGQYQCKPGYTAMDQRAGMCINGQFDARCERNEHSGKFLMRGKWLTFHRRPAYNLNANNNCARTGGALLRIDSDLLNQDVLDRMTTVDKVSMVWLGLSDLGHESVWKWSTGPAAVPYTDWLPGNPTRPGGFLLNDCAAITTEGYGWRSQVCVARQAYYCQQLCRMGPFEPGFNRFIDSFGNYTCKPGYLKLAHGPPTCKFGIFHSSCYNPCGEGTQPWILNGEASCLRFSSIKMNFTKALDTCVAWGSSLLRLGNVNEDGRFFEVFLGEQHQQFMWIGLTDQAQEGRWTWTEDNSVATFTRWHPGQPNGGRRENCAQYHGHDRWTDVACSSQQAFYCQRTVCFKGPHNPGFERFLPNESTEREFQYSCKFGYIKVFQRQPARCVDGVWEVDCLNPCPAGQYFAIDRCVKYHAQRLNWANALATCQREGGTLINAVRGDFADVIASNISSMVAAGQIVRGGAHFRYYDTGVWMGLYRSGFEWTAQHAQIDYDFFGTVRRWAPGSVADDNCVMLRGDNYWEPRDCREENPFYCQNDLECSAGSFIISIGGLHVNADRTYTCRPNYEKRGNGLATCHRGRWRVNCHHDFAISERYPGDPTSPVNQ